jgi:hypothetical protein
MSPSPCEECRFWRAPVLNFDGRYRSRFFFETKSMVHSSGRDALPDSTEQRSLIARWIYRLIAFVSALFIITIFVMIAVTMSDPTVPVNRSMSVWLDRYAASFLIAEVATIGALVMFAFLLDRRESWKRYHREYAQWETRMQQVAGQNGTNPEIHSQPDAVTSPGDAE